MTVVVKNEDICVNPVFSYLGDLVVAEDELDRLKFRAVDALCILCYASSYA